MTEQPNDPQPNDPQPQDDPGQQQRSWQPPPPQAPYKRLTRTQYDAPISGVCGGVARYLNVDPTLVRVLAVIAVVVTFPVGLIVYSILWAVIPKG